MSLGLALCTYWLSRQDHSFGKTIYGLAAKTGIHNYIALPKFPSFLIFFFLSRNLMRFQTRFQKRIRSTLFYFFKVSQVFEKKGFITLS